MKIFHGAASFLRRSDNERAMSLQVRFFIFFALFAVFVGGAGLAVLYFTGVFKASERLHSTWLDAELVHHQNNVSSDFSRLSLRGVSLARTLSSRIHAFVQRYGITEKEIAFHPELIEDLLADQAGILLAVLENNTCSGAFIILEATINPYIENAEYSRAGIYFTAMEPNVISSINTRVYCLRGPASVSRANGIELLAQWRMEFRVDDMDFYEKVLETARKNIDTDLSRLYYWSKRYLMAGNSEHCLMLCIPLAALDGTVYGVCGIEVSAMMFKRLYSPDNSQYPRVFTALAPFDGDSFDTGAGLIAGNSFLTSQTTDMLTAGKGNGVLLHSYDGSAYTGRMAAIRLYPSGSPFAGETWALALLMPESDWMALVNQNRFIFYGAVVALLIGGIAVSLFVSKRFIKPVTSVLDDIKTGNLDKADKTRIAEIDSLLEYIAELIEERKVLEEKTIVSAEEKGAPIPVKQHKDYASQPVNLGAAAFEKLSYQELRVADLTLRGYSYTDIAETLKLKPSTVKWYQKILYSKLEISSKRELFALAENRG